MDFFTSLKDTPVPTLLIILGCICLLIGIVNGFTLLQIPRLDANWQRWTVSSMGIVLLIAGLLFYAQPTFLFAHTSSTPTPTPPATSTSAPVVLPTAPTSTSTEDDSASSLIPPGQQPVINDPLKDNSGGYEWDIQSDANGSCGFAQGAYILSDKAGDSGIGCQAGSSTGTFSNFVYQIRMIILAGVDNGESGAGPTFRTNTAGTGQQYQVQFGVNGAWEVATDIKPLVGGICANPCPYFHVGLNKANYITIRTSGNHIQIQINGHDLSSYTDSTYTSGAIGVQLSPGTENSSVAFSDVRVWRL